MLTINKHRTEHGSIFKNNEKLGGKKVSQAVQWINKHFYIMEYYISISIKQVIVTYNNVDESKNIMLSEGNNIQEYLLYKSIYYKVQKLAKQTHGHRS